MYVYIHMYVKYMHTQTHGCTHAHMHTQLAVKSHRNRLQHLRTYTNTYMHAYTHHGLQSAGISREEYYRSGYQKVSTSDPDEEQRPPGTSMYACTYACACVCMHVCLCVCMCVRVHTLEAYVRFLTIHCIHLICSDV
jgi:hypothetical protein